MGLDQSMPTQFVTFLGHVVDGSLGHQCPNPRQRPTVADRIFTVLPYTVRLALTGMALAFVLALQIFVNRERSSQMNMKTRFFFTRNGLFIFSQQQRHSSFHPP